MNKIRVVHHSNQLGLGGTEKVMQLFCKYLDKERFDVYALAPKYPVARYKLWINGVKSFLGQTKARERAERYKLNHARAPVFTEILGLDKVILYQPQELAGIMRKIKPHILHVHHSGVSDPPLNQPEIVDPIPLLFTVNMFGYQGKPEHQRKLTRIIFPSQWLKEMGAPWSKKDPRCTLLYCPIEKPATEQNLRSELGIDPQTFVIGRIGRNADDIYDPISLRAYKEIESDLTLFLAVAPPPRMKADAQAFGIRRIRYLEPTVDELYLSKFYNTLDAFAHARLDGETFGCVIAEAMKHSLPILTHRSHVRNSQLELVDDSCGFITNQNDWQAYAKALLQLRDHPSERKQMGKNALAKALKFYEAGTITQKLEEMYLEELQKKGIYQRRF